MDSCILFLIFTLVPKPNRMRWILIFTLQLSAAFCLAQNSIVLQNGNLIQVETDLIQENMSILITDDKIVQIGNFADLNVPSDAEIIDCTGKWFSPGLVDAHIHLFQDGGLYTRPDAIDLRKYVSYEENQQWLQNNADDLLRRYLRCGITTVIDVGGPMRNYDTRDHFNQQLTSPSIYLTGPLVSTYQPEAFQIDDPPIVKVNSAEEARALVRKQLPYKPDFIKIWYIASRNMTAEENFELVKATIDESHKNNLKVAVHATQLNTAKLAVKAGADILVHSVSNTDVDEEFAEMLVDNNVAYIPTLVVSGNYNVISGDYERISELDFVLSNPTPVSSFFDLAHLDEPELKASLQAQLPDRKVRTSMSEATMRHSLEKLHKAGVLIATGTDAGNPGTFHATSYYTELEAMKNAGMTNLEVLRASTINGAKALDKQSEFGSIRVGKRADILVLNSNPLEDLNNLLDMSYLVNRGHLIQPDTLIAETPEMLAQKQLNAYNARNIDAFLEPYSEDVALYNFPNELIYQGKEQMRANYQGMFENVPDLHCELVNRIVLGNTVIDQERVTGFPNGEVIEAVAIYKIADGKIKAVYFMRK